MRSSLRLSWARSCGGCDLRAPHFRGWEQVGVTPPSSRGRPRARPPELALARSCCSSQQLPQAVRGGQCTTKEGCYPQPRKPPCLILDTDGRHCGTTQGPDARHHKPREILQRAFFTAHYLLLSHCR